MRKIAKIITVACVFTMILSGCGSEITQEQVDELQAQLDTAQSDREDLQSDYNTLKSDYDGLKEQYDSLQSEYEQLKTETADFMKLTADEKAAELARAEAERIAAEEEAQKAKAEQEAAEKAAAEEAARLAAEEAAAREEEEKKGYDTGITFDDLARRPDDYEGKKVKFKGEVLQVNEYKDETQIRLATKNDGYGYYDDVIYIYFPSALLDSRILEDDIITIYGTSRNLYTYETVMGSSVTLPLIEVDKIDQ